MSTHELLYKAIKIATKAHKKQTDKYDAPYLGHVFRVMNAGKTIDEKIVGVLHDVVEDHPEFSLEYLTEKGFPDLSGPGGVHQRYHAAIPPERW